MNKTIFINIRQISTGFIEVPGQVSLNIYVQGCEKRCIGCHNIEGQSFDGGMKFFAADIDAVKKDFGMCNWVCWLGGDAVYQPESFKIFNSEFASRGFKIALYTGRSLKEVENLLSNVNLVIDGEWKGKTVQDRDTNQKIWYRESLNSCLNLVKDWDDLSLLLNAR